MVNVCNGKIKIPKKLIKKGITDECHNIAYKICGVCRKYFCHNHIYKHQCMATADNSDFKTASPKLKHS